MIRWNRHTHPQRVKALLLRIKCSPRTRYYTISHPCHSPSVGMLVGWFEFPFAPKFGIQITNQFIHECGRRTIPKGYVSTGTNDRPSARQILSTIPCGQEVVFRTHQTAIHPTNIYILPTLLLYTLTLDSSHANYCTHPRLGVNYSSIRGWVSTQPCPR